MKPIIQSRTEFLENGGTFKGYFEQWATAKPVVGEVYTVNKGNFMGCDVQITYIDEKVALGVEIKGLCVGERWLFHSTGNAAGFRYNDHRPGFRLYPKEVRK